MVIPPDNVRISYLDSSIASNNYVWDTGSLSWVPMEGSSGVGANVIVTNFPASQTVDDGGLSLTVDGTVSIANFPATQPVSGTVSATQGTSPWVGNTTQLSGTAIDTGSGASSAGTQRVILATNQPVIPVSDNGSSLTVDGTVTATQSGSWSITDGGAGKTLKSASFSLSATGTVVSAVASKRIKVYAIKLVVSAAISVNFRDGGTTALEGAQPLPANGGFVETLNPPAFLFGTTAGNSLDLVISGTGTASGRVSYWDDDAT